MNRAKVNVLKFWNPEMKIKWVAVLDQQRNNAAPSMLHGPVDL